MTDDDPRSSTSPYVLRVEGRSQISGTVPDPMVVPEGTPPEDVITLYGIIGWANARALPKYFLDRIPKLATRDPFTVREVADDLADLGYPWTANELRAYWRANT